MTETTALVRWQPTTIVTTGIITVCCSFHVLPPNSCCDVSDCGPCCAECPTCPIVQAREPDQRREDARADRDADRDLERLILDEIRARTATEDIATICRSTANAVMAALYLMPVTTTETDLRNQPCTGCAGTSLVHTYTHQCNWNGLAVTSG
jgi:hypothetical protein